MLRLLYYHRHIYSLEAEKVCLESYYSDTPLAAARELLMDKKCWWFFGSEFCCARPLPESKKENNDDITRRLTGFKKHFRSTDAHKIITESEASVNYFYCEKE